MGFVNNFSKRQIIAVVSCLAIILIVGVSIFIINKFKADTPGTSIINQATITYTDSQGQAKTITSNPVVTTVVTTPDTRTIYGTVTHLDGSPFPNVTVYVKKWSDDGFRGTSYISMPNMVTDSNGKYQSKYPVAQGAYTIQFFPPASSPDISVGMYDKYLAAGQTFGESNAVLRETPILRGRISYDGWLKEYNSAGHLSGATCELADTANHKITKTTDDQGNFLIYNSDMGSNPYTEYAITCTKTNYTITGSWGSDKASGLTPKITLDSTKNKYVVVYATDATTHTAIINLTVKDSGGKSLTSSVTVTRKPNGATKNFSFGSDMVNRKISYLAEGDWKLTVVGPSGYATYVNDALHLTNGQTADINVVLPLSPSAKITGKITSSDPNRSFIMRYIDKPSVVELLDNNDNVLARSVRISYDNVYANNTVSVNTDFLPYTFSKDVPAGTYKIRVSAYGFAAKTVSNIVVPSSLGTITQDISIDPGCQLTGSVTDSSGQAIPWAKAEALKSDGTVLDSWIIKTTDDPNIVEYWQDNWYHLGRNLGAGNYTIRVSAIDYQTQTLDSVSCTNNEMLINNFTLVNPQQSAPQVQSSVGTVKNLSESEIAAITSSSTAESSSTDSTQPGSSPDSTSQTITQPSAAAILEPVTAAELPYGVKPSILNTDPSIETTFAMETITLPTVNGTVLDSNSNKPVSRAQVAIVENNHVIANTATDQKGKYTIESENINKDKEYKLVVDKPGEYSTQKTFKAKDTKQDIKVKQKPWLTRGWYRVKTFFIGMFK